MAEDLVAEPYSFAMTSALAALAPRAKSRAELFQHLIKRKVDPEIAESVLDELELKGFLNDLEFAQLWAESRQRQKKISRRLIAGQLRSKGVAQDIIDEVISKIDSESEYRLAYQLAEKKYRSCAHLEAEKIYARISGVLIRKGFSANLAPQIIRELLTNQPSN